MVGMKLAIDKNWFKPSISSLIGQTMALSNREATRFTKEEIVTTPMVAELRKSMIKKRICLVILESHMLSIAK